MPELKELLAPLKQYMGDDEDKRTEVADALHADLPAVAQVLIDKGAGLGKGELKKQLKAAKDEAKAALARQEELEGELEEARSKSPEEVQKLQRKVDTLSAQLETAKGETAQEREARKADRRAGDIERFKKFLKPGQPGGVQEGYDEDLARAYADRLDEDEEGRRVVKQIGSDAVYAPANGKDPLELLAADAVKRAPAWARLTGVEAGGGQGGGGGGGGGDKKFDTQQFQKQRDARANPLLPQRQTAATTQER